MAIIRALIKKSVYIFSFKVRKVRALSSCEAYLNMKLKVCLRTLHPNCHDPEIDVFRPHENQCQIIINMPIDFALIEISKIKCQISDNKANKNGNHEFNSPALFWFQITEN